MTDDLVVVADGASKTEPSHRNRQNSHVVVPLVAFALGLGLGVIVVSPTAETPVEDGAQLGAPVVEPIPNVFDSGLGELVPGLTDSMVAVVQRGSDGYNRLFWPADRALSETDVGFGAEVALDVSGQILATTEIVPGLDGAVLTMGRITSPTPVAAGVTSFSWHDGKAGHLGYTIETDGEWALWRVFTDNQAILVADSLVGPGWIAAWGDWGWAIQRSETEVALLTPDGELKTTHQGRVLSSHESGWLLIANDDLELVSAGGGVRRLDIAPDRVGLLDNAAFSPDGNSLAIAGDRGVLVFPVLGEGLISEIEAASSSNLAWSTDSRFVVLATGRGVSIVDLDTVTSKAVLTNPSVLSVRMVAGTS